MAQKGQYLAQNDQKCQIWPISYEVGRHSIDRAAHAPQPLANKPTVHSACTARAG